MGQTQELEERGEPTEIRGPVEMAEVILRLLVSLEMTAAWGGLEQ
jgi:hypothetical protein